MKRKPMIARFLSSFDTGKEDECWNWKRSTDRLGYARISPGGRGSTPMLAHRMSWETYRGPIPDGMCVCHRCDNPSCVNPSHLFLGTKKENSEDMVTKRRSRGAPPGVNHPRAKLNPEKVRIIRTCSTGPAELARRFGVTGSTICNVRSRRVWRHVP